MQSLRQQLDRLDPARKCLAVSGFIEKDLFKRAVCIQAILAELGGCPKEVSFDTIHKGNAMHACLLE